MNSIFKKGMLPVAVAIAMLGVIGAFGGNTKTAEAFVPGDICLAQVVHAGSTAPLAPTTAYTAPGGQSNVPVHVVTKGVKYSMVFRVEDILTALDITLPGDDVGVVLPGPNVDVEVDSETGSARLTSKAEAFPPFANRGSTSLSTGTVDPLIGVPSISHQIIAPGVLSQVVQTFNPRFINNSNGFTLDTINNWVVNGTGMPGVFNNATSVCGTSTSTKNFIPGLDGAWPGDDAWGYVDFECVESGFFHIDLRMDDWAYGLVADLVNTLEDIGANLQPDIEDFIEGFLYWNQDSARTGLTVKFYCLGQPDTATISPESGTVETQPTGVAPNGLGTKTITVTVKDQDGKRLDGAEVTFTTDNCTFNGDSNTTPAGGGTTVTTYSDTDSTPDTNFVTNNPLEVSAGTAEAVLNCTTPAGKAGTANITAIVDRPGSDIVLKSKITVVGPTAVTGLTLTLTPDDLECGETLLAVAEAVDSSGAAVSDGTVVYFTTDTSSGVVGGDEGAQGGVYTEGGTADVLIATDPGNPGVHTVIAYVINSAGTPKAQTSATYTCDAAVAPAAPTVAPPATGTGTGSITPPNTGDAGLATGGSPSTSLFVLAGAVVLFMAGLASVRFARN